MKSYSKTGASVALIAAMLLGLLALTAPGAAAQTEYGGVASVPAGTSCPAGYTDQGPWAIGGSNTWNHYCTQDGYNMLVTTAAECAAANGAASVPFWAYAHLVTHNGSGLCVWDTWSPGYPCGAGQIPGQDSAGTEWCLVPVYKRGGDGAAGIRSATPACIETDLVQSNAAPGMGVGSRFTNDGSVYVIISADATCTFNCYNGWDINCDGKLGDFCSVELDRKNVGDVGTCMAALGIEPT